MVTKHMKRCLASSVIRERQIKTARGTTPQPFRWLKWNRKEITNAGEEWRSGDHNIWLMRMEKGRATLENGFTMSSKGQHIVTTCS